MRTIEKIDACYFLLGVRIPSGLRFTGGDIHTCLHTLSKLSTCIINHRKLLFLETQMGVGVIDEVDMYHIHLLYFTGQFKGQGEWINIETKRGSLTNTPREFIPH